MTAETEEELIKRLNEWKVTTLWRYTNLLIIIIIIIRKIT